MAAPTAPVYTYILTTPVGLVRLAIGDPVKGDTAYFTDAEINAYLTGAAGDVGRASIAALRGWARRYATKKKEQIGDYTVDYGAMAKTLAGLADQLSAELGDEADDVAVGELPGDHWLRY